MYALPFLTLRNLFCPHISFVCKQRFFPHTASSGILRNGPLKLEAIPRFWTSGIRFILISGLINILAFPPASSNAKYSQSPSCYCMLLNYSSWFKFIRIKPLALRRHQISFNFQQFTIMSEFRGLFTYHQSSVFTFKRVYFRRTIWLILENC